MKKYLLFFSIMMLASISFAIGVGVSDSAYNMYVQTCCNHRVVDGLLGAAYNYYIYDGNDCINQHSFIASERDYLSGLMYGEGGVSDYYYRMANACQSGPSIECSSAQREFYSNSKGARVEFNSGKSLYYSTARSALASGCGTSPAQIAGDLGPTTSVYKDCINSGCVRPRPPPFPPRPPRPPFPRPWPPIIR